MKIVADQNNLVYGDDIVGYGIHNKQSSCIDDGDMMIRAIYRNITQDDRYVVGAVSFNDFESERVFDVWANSTYDNCYQAASYNSYYDFNRHRQEIENAVANAINKFDIPGRL